MENKRFLALQLFAEGTDSVDPTTTDTQTDDSKASGSKDAGSPKDPPAEPKYTDDDVNKLIDQKFAEWQKKQQKAVDEAKKLAEMNAQEKAEYERDQLQKQLAEYQKKDTLSEMAGTARKMLADSHITVSDELLKMLVSDDAETTKTAVDSFAKAFDTAVEEAVKDKVKGKTPLKGGSGSAMTKEQIMEIQDPELRQQKMLENRELFDI